MARVRVSELAKEYGVTSLGVVKFAEISMAELGIDIRRDDFSVKFTGGPTLDRLAEWPQAASVSLDATTLTLTFPNPVSGDKAVLAVVSNAATNVGMINIEARSAAQKIAQVLG